MDVDLDLFSRLETLYKALVGSVDNALCFEDPEDGMMVLFSQDEVPLIHERIQFHGQALTEHYKKHKSLCACFYSIEEDANTGNRTRVTINIEKLLRGTRELLDFIKGYYEKWDEASPFFYPAYDGFSFSFFPVKPGEAGRVFFNPEGSYEGAMAGLEAIDDLLGKFNEKPSRLDYPVKPSGTVFRDGEELNDFYTHALERTKKVFAEEFNFDIDPGKA